MKMLSRSALASCLPWPPRSAYDRAPPPELPSGWVVCVLVHGRRTRPPTLRCAEATMTNHEPGSEIAGYRIESLIGRGGMAVVYRAEDMRLGRKVALKLLPPLLADSEQFRQRFMRESRLAASLDHPNIVPIYEAGEADGQLFIAMRYVL